MPSRVGKFPLARDDVLRMFWAKLTGASHALPAATEAVVCDIRGARIAGAIPVRAALSAAGAAYQGLFRNPLISPEILNVSSRAALGAAASRPHARAGGAGAAITPAALKTLSGVDVEDRGSNGRPPPARLRAGAARRKHLGIRR